MIDLQAHKSNSELSTDAVLQTLRADIKRHAYIVGAWVWVEFPERPEKNVTEYLSELGFHWNGKRRVWQHSGGVYRRADRRGDPRFRYGMQRLETND